LTENGEVFNWAYEITVKNTAYFFLKRESRCIYKRKAKVILSLIKSVQVQII